MGGKGEVPPVPYARKRLKTMIPSLSLTFSESWEIHMVKDMR
jgi:hypothetical protein